MPKTQTQPKPKADPSPPPSPPRAARPGLITHTELASKDPAATKRFCQEAFGWSFGDPVPTPNGDYHMWRMPGDTGGGIRACNPQEPGGSTPYLEFPDIKEAEAKARKHGATVLLPPQRLPDGSSICVVHAPGGVPIGFWAPK